MLSEVDLRMLTRFAYIVGWKGIRSIRKFRKQSKAGRVFPPFVFLSITNACNLRCQGCWVTQASSTESISSAHMDRIIDACKREGSHFFGILGGEPLLHPDFFDIARRHQDCVFQVFSNGTLIDEAVAREMRLCGNITPLISIEGLEETSDERRGGVNVYRKAVEAIEHCSRNRLFTGVASSVCKSNIAEVATGDFVDDMIKRGVHYLWYYIYRPVGAEPSPELVLDKREVSNLRRFMVDIRRTAPILVVDAYWDHEGRALCPAAAGISHHIGPAGYLEPCPPIQFAREDLKNGGDITELITRSGFLERFRETAASATRGCIIMEHPQKLREFMINENAVDTSGRGTALEELRMMQSLPSHDMGDARIPERHWLYRFAKKHWFFGFGAYG
ncbi:MAG: radical SAM protein [Verrucomicrobia bacterium]|nr:radical SAM protein [Verrucomicrobiota bacterium]